MARKTVIECDACGKIIESQKILKDRYDEDPTWKFKVRMGGDANYAFVSNECVLDLCDECHPKIELKLVKAINKELSTLKGCPEGLSEDVRVRKNKEAEEK